MLHPFQEAGLGTAPYQLTHVTEEGGACHYCGTRIVYRYYCDAADGKQFFVGSDCIYKVTGTGDQSLVYAAREAKKKFDEHRIQSAAEALTRSPHMFTDRPHPRGFTRKTYRDDVTWRLGSYSTRLRQQAAREVEQALAAA